jgi:TolA-binding protein
VYPEQRVAQFVERNFIPVRRHVKNSQDQMARFEVQWTPTVLVVDSNGKERHRIEGFLPAEDFLAQLELGAAHAAFSEGRFDEAERAYRKIVEEHPENDAAAESQYWAGVSRYKATNDPGALKATTEAFQKRYSDTSWAKKASVWG